jgi:hypothetical protein
MGKLFAQGYLDFDKNFEAVDQDMTGDLNTIITQLDR